MSKINASDAGTIRAGEEVIKALFPSLLGSRETRAGDGNQHSVALAAVAGEAKAVAQVPGLVIEVRALLPLGGDAIAENRIQNDAYRGNQLIVSNRNTPITPIERGLKDGEIDPIDKGGITTITTPSRYLYYLSVLGD